MIQNFTLIEHKIHTIFLLSGYSNKNLSFRIKNVGVNDMNNLGDILKETRQKKQLSQLETAEDICSQSTLSEIEHNKYIPNTQLLINLCQRLSINFKDLVLSENFKVCKEKYFNQKVKSFYKSCDYHALNAFLNRPTVTETVQTSKQTQAYYLYLSICAPATRGQGGRRPRNACRRRSPCFNVPAWSLRPFCAAAVLHAARPPSVSGR